MDENDENMEEQLEWDGDNGIVNMVGMYIRHPDKEFCDYYQSLLMAMYEEDSVGEKHVNKEQQDKDMDKNEVTPLRGQLRKRAHEKMAKAALTMKKCVLEKVGDGKVCEVGEVVHVPLKDMD
jgi:hypothetical protein